ncbi:MAG: LysR family transcriptional regulator [Acetobacteraceae bacterium]|nr:LysR family transcriptional regulator [Acetobacteraceae bacterium]
MAVLGSPSYFKDRTAPKKPPHLIGHNCIGLRLPTHGGLYAWEFEKGGHKLKVRIEGQLIFNTAAQMLNAALAGLGLAYLPEGMVKGCLTQGQLNRVLEDWCLPYPGYHLWYPSRRQSSAAFALLIEALRDRDPRIQAIPMSILDHVIRPEPALSGFLAGFDLERRVADPKALPQAG